MLSGPCNCLNTHHFGLRLHVCFLFFSGQGVDGEIFLDFSEAELLANFPNIADEEQRKIMSIVKGAQTSAPPDQSFNLVQFFLCNFYTCFFGSNDY